MHLRLIDDPPCDPSWNMALDEALLRVADEPVLRLYGWRPHAVSLGYFQDLAAFADLPPGTRIVRRLTGGGAIHHGDELTFALVLGADLLPRDVDASYAAVHDAIVRALRATGVDTERRLDGATSGARPSSRWCFAEPGRNDLVDDLGRKLCGSAQRRIRTARGPRVLHHGSLVLERPALTPFVAAVADRTATAGVEARLRRAVTVEVAATLGRRPVPSTPSPAETALARALARQRYSDPGFPRAGRAHAR